jgi:hypothetical protein
MYKECRHVMPTGLHCQSPAMRGSDFCYFHVRARQMVRPSRSREARIEFPAVLDSAGIRKTNAKILQALGAGLISPRRAAVILYGLQMATGQAHVSGELDTILEELASEALAKSAGRAKASPAL